MGGIQRPKVAVAPAIALATLLLGCGPQNYNECTRQAARESRSDLALRVLIQACSEDFPGDRGARSAAHAYSAPFWIVATAIPTLILGYVIGRRRGRRAARTSANASASVATDEDPEVILITRTPGKAKPQHSPETGLPPVADPNASVKREALRARIGTDGITELMFCSADGDVRRVKELLAAGADPNARSAKGLTALMYAADARAGEVMAELIAAGADKDIRNSFGKTATDYLKTRAAHRGST